ITHVDSLIMRRRGPAVGHLLGGLGQHRFAPPPQVHLCAVLGQAGGHPAAETGSAACDEDPLIRQEIGCKDLTLGWAHNRKLPSNRSVSLPSLRHTVIV